MKKKLIALLLLVAVTLVPLTVFAESAEAIGGLSTLELNDIRLNKSLPDLVNLGWMGDDLGNPLETVFRGLRGSFDAECVAGCPPPYDISGDGVIVIRRLDLRLRRGPGNTVMINGRATGGLGFVDLLGTPTLLALFKGADITGMATCDGPAGTRAASWVSISCSISMALTDTGTRPAPDRSPWKAF